jgi:glucosamine-6-phosphate deaminase
LIEQIPEHKKILIFSPHPDDEIIGMGATIYKIAHRGNVFKIVYLTDGERGVPGSMAQSKKKELRRREAKKAVAVLGVKEKNLEFLNLPYYYTRMVSTEDVDEVFALLTTFMPDIVFVCIDNDPNSTHKKGAEIIDEALIQYEIPTLIYCYKSIWEEFKPREVNFCVGFDQGVMDLKIESLKQFRSQQKNPDVHSEDDPLWERVRRRDFKLAHELGIKHPYAEGFFRTESL